MWQKFISVFLREFDFLRGITFQTNVFNDRKLLLKQVIIHFVIFLKQRTEILLLCLVLECQSISNTCLDGHASYLNVWFSSCSSISISISEKSGRNTWRVTRFRLVVCQHTVQNLIRHLLQEIHLDQSQTRCLWQFCA